MAFSRFSMRSQCPKVDIVYQSENQEQKMARRPVNRSKTDFENSVTPPERKYDPAKYEPTSIWSSGCQQTYPSNSVRTRESHPSKYEQANQASGSSFDYSAQQSIPSTSGYSSEFTNPAGYEEPSKTRGGPVSSYPSQQTAKRIVYSNSGYPPQTSNSKEEYQSTYKTNYVISSSCGPPAEAAKVVVCSVKSRFDAHLNQQPKQAVSVESASYGTRGSNHHDTFGSEPIRGRPVAEADTYKTSSSQVAGKYRSSTMLSPHQDIPGIVFKLCTCILYTLNLIIECNAKCRHLTN
jgi:hypothetical protein